MAKPDWRRPVKTTARKSANPPARETARLSTKVSREAYQRLFVASVMEGLPAGDILDRLILDHCRSWSLPGKITARNAIHDRVIPDGPVNMDTQSPALSDAA